MDFVNSTNDKSITTFLDETINNIDHDTIWLVADMLDDYIKMSNMSLYVVTHSEQLQNMDVWDNIITL